jgi:hypothetical protein
MMRRSWLAAIVAACAFVALAVLPSVGGAHHPRQHDPVADDHLTGTGAWGKLEFLGKADVATAENTVADVAVDPDGEVAYLAHWGEPDCGANSEKGGQNSPDAGVWVIDISGVEDVSAGTPTNFADFPVIGFIPHSQDSRPGEGLQAVEISTKFFNGTMLVSNNEQCGKNGKGGVSLYDVTNPTKPVKLSEHFGDRNPGDTNETHSAFAWDVGDRAYLVMTDNAEASDVDILDITNPKRPRLIADLNLNTYCGDMDQSEIGLSESSLHDMIVKQIGGDWIMLLSYWDGGYVQMNVNNPAAPVCLDDTDFTHPDPELLESAGISRPPEGNAHQAEFTIDNRFFIGTDEDFSPYKGIFTIDTGPNAGPYTAGEFGWTEPIVEQPGDQVSGVTVFGGYGCPGDPANDDVPTAQEVRDADPNDAITATTQLILVTQRGPVEDPSASYEACFFSNKVEFAQNLGYDMAIVANHHVGAQAGAAPDAEFCGSKGHEFVVTIPAICIGHRAMHLLFNDAPDYSVPYSGTEPAIGAIGETVTAKAEFDGWGYVHLFDAATGEELDTYAIPEAHQESKAFGSGDLTVHEVAVDPQNANFAYLSYYGGGMRALEIQCSNPADTSTCELVEAGGYLDPLGNDFWGVEAFVGDDGQTYVLGSDMDSGLWVFRDP